MELLLWVLVPLLVVSLVLYSWIIWDRDDGGREVALTLSLFLGNPVKRLHDTVGFEDLHALQAPLTNRPNVRPPLGDNSLTPGHWTLSGEAPTPWFL